MTKRFSLLLLFFALLHLRLAWAQTIPAELIRYPETILHNGKVVAMDNKTPPRVRARSAKRWRSGTGKFWRMDRTAEYWR
jgi:hypothetical protein